MLIFLKIMINIVTFPGRFLLAGFIYVLLLFSLFSTITNPEFINEAEDFADKILESKWIKGIKIKNKEEK